MSLHTVGDFLLNPAVMEYMEGMGTVQTFKRFRVARPCPVFPKDLREIYVSPTYLVQVFEFALSIRRCNGNDIREDWSEVQRIKEVIWPETWCIEHFPPPCETVNEAKMRWLWKVGPDLVKQLPQFPGVN